MAETNTNETVEMTENQNETNPAAQGEQPADNAELTKLKADLAKQKAEERAKKIQAFFRAKHPEATTMPDGAPIKRPRGRPRKNPL